MRKTERQVAIRFIVSSRALQTVGLATKLLKLAKWGVTHFCKLRTSAWSIEIQDPDGRFNRWVLEPKAARPEPAKEHTA